MLGLLILNSADDEFAGGHPSARERTGHADRRRGLDSFLATVERKAFHMARYALRDRELALDVVQDSMLRLVEHYADKAPGEWPAIFFTILHNRINDMRRLRFARHGLQQLITLFGQTKAGEDADADGDIFASDDRAGPERALASRRLAQAIDAAMNTLPFRQRQVFILREWQELSIKETAQVMDCAEGTVKQHHFRALQTLRALLAKEWKDD